MAIAKMNKFTLLTFHGHKQALLKQLQVFGDVHFKTLGQREMEQIDFLRPDFSPDQLSRYEAELEKVRFCVGKLKPFADKPKLGEKRATLSFAEFDRYVAEYDYGAVYEKVKEQDEAIAAMKADVLRRNAENESLRPWLRLDVSPAQLDSLKEAGYLLGTVNRQMAEELKAKLTKRFPAVYIESLDTVKDDVTLLLLFLAEEYEDLHAAARELGFAKAAFQLRGMPRELVVENERAVREAQEKQVQAQAAIEALLPELPKLEVALDCFSTVLERERACQNFLRSDTVVLIEGWVPADDSQKLKALLGSVCGKEYFLEETAVEKDSLTTPIKLKNNKFVKAFESITEMYSMPKYGEIDPTPILAPFYWLFFGMMVGDVGYGLVLLLGTTVVLKLIDLKAGMRSFIEFFRYLSISIILMGAVYGGVFGVTLIKPIQVINEAGQAVYKPILDSQLDIVTMLILSIVIGVFHILCGLSIKAYIGFRDGKPMDGLLDGVVFMITLLSGIGWLLGATGLFPSAMLGTVCMWVFYGCLLLIACTQGRSSPSLGGKIGNGLYSVYGLTSYVGDIVSYTRIVALALSGAYIAYAFNLMAGLVAGQFGAGPIVVSLLRFVFAAVVAVFGQVLNFGLSLLGAYVHTCRLQYVEYFGKFYEGGGVVFKPLTLKNEHIHITK